MKNSFLQKSLLLLCCINLTILSAPTDLVSPEVAKEMVTKIYEPVGNAGFRIPQEETDLIIEKKGAPTYGEITWDSGIKLFEELKLTANDEFWDIGSGVGKLTIQAYLLTPVRRSLGIELSNTRFNHAKDAKDKLLSDLLKKIGKRKFNAFTKGRSLEFVKANCVESPELWKSKSPTVVYMCATCFGPELMKEITDLSGNKSSVKRVVTLQQLPENNYFELYATEHYPMTWSGERGVPVYFYKRINTDKEEVDKTAKTKNSITKNRSVKSSSKISRVANSKTKTR